MTRLVSSGSGRRAAPSPFVPSKPVLPPNVGNIVKGGRGKAKDSQRLPSFVEEILQDGKMR